MTISTFTGNTDNRTQNKDTNNNMSGTVITMGIKPTQPQKKRDDATKFIVANSFKLGNEDDVKKAVLQIIIDRLVDECKRGGDTYAV